MFEREPKTPVQKVNSVAKVVILSLFWFLVDNWIQYLNPETILRNWELGMIFGSIFLVLYFLDFRYFPFRYDWLTFSLFSFFLGFFLADIQDFLTFVGVI